MFKKDGFFGYCINVGTCLAGIAVAAEVVGPERIDADENDVTNFFR